MQEWQNRVINEQYLLEEKAKTLYVFLAGKQVEALPKEDQELLMTQYCAMMVYSSILTQRINRFN